MITAETVNAIKSALPGKTIGLVGDFCIDVYWEADMTKSELSRETPNFPLPVVNERIYLGAGGNVASNMAALGPGEILALCLCGNDWRADAMKRIIKNNGISDKFVITDDSLVTNAYCKPMKKGISATVYEDPRLDFENREPISEALENRVIENLKIMLLSADVIVVADQFRYGIVTEKVRKMLCDAAKRGKTVIADSRYNIGLYTDCIIKPNEVECYRAIHDDKGYMNASTQDFCDCAKALSEKNRVTVFCTLGDRGSMIVNGDSVEYIDAVKVSGPLDICGAGDTSVSAFACAVASGCTFAQAAAFAGAASSVTIRKVGVTGTATFEEIEAATGIRP